MTVSQTFVWATAEGAGEGDDSQWVRSFKVAHASKYSDHRFDGRAKHLSEFRYLLQGREHELGESLLGVRISVRKRDTVSLHDLGKRVTFATDEQEKRLDMRESLFGFSNR